MILWADIVCAFCDWARYTAYMTQLMAVINTTAQSIDAEHRTIEDPVERARQAFRDGAHWVDIGGQATNPWADEGSSDEEWNSIEPVLVQLLDEFPGRVSLDTFRPSVAERALSLGNVILNDVTGFTDPVMVNLAVQHQTLCIVSHLPHAAKGNISWAHKHPQMDSETEVLDELLQRRRLMINAGIDPTNIILDPGIGFGKTKELNYRLLKFGQLMTDRLLLQKLDSQALDEPVIKVMIGHSEKRMIADYFGGDKRETVANLRAALIAIHAQASYLRVHDVPAHAELIRSAS